MATMKAARWHNRKDVRVEEKGLIYDLHHPKFNIDEESLKIGMGLQLKNILEYLK